MDSSVQQYNQEHDQISENQSYAIQNIPSRYRSHRSVQVAKRINDSIEHLNALQNNKSGKQQQSYLPSIGYTDKELEEYQNQQLNLFDNKRQNENQADPGIQLDSRGKIQPYTIAGKTEWFIKEENRRELLKSNINSEEEQQRRQRAMTQELKRNIAKSYANKTKKQDRKRSFRSSTNQVEQDPKYQEEILTKNEVIERIQSTISRVRTNSEHSTRYNKLIYKRIEPGEQLLYTKDQRIMDKFENQKQYWQNMINQTTSIVNKPFNNSLYMRSEQFRAKKEIDKAIENLESDPKRYGDRYWLMTLRHYEGQQKFSRHPSQKVMDDLPHGFKTFQQVRQDQPLEIIRKPYSHNLKSKHEGMTPYLSLRASKSLKTRSEKTPSFEINDVYQKEQSGVDTLEIKGKSVLNEEIKNLIEDENTNIYKLRQLKDDLEETQQHFDDVIEANYDKKKLSTTGGLTMTKFSFKN